MRWLLQHGAARREVSVDENQIVAQAARCSAADENAKFVKQRVAVATGALARLKVPLTSVPGWDSEVCELFREVQSIAFDVTPPCDDCGKNLEEAQVALTKAEELLDKATAQAAASEHAVNMALQHCVEKAEAYLGQVSTVASSIPP